MHPIWAAHPRTHLSTEYPPRVKIIWDASLLWLRNKNGRPMDTNFKFLTA